MDKIDHIKRAVEQLKNELEPRCYSHIAIITSHHDPERIGSYTFVLRGFNKKLYKEVCTAEEFVAFRDMNFKYIDPNGDPCVIVAELNNKAWVEYLDNTIDDRVWYMSELTSLTLTYVQFYSKVFELRQKAETLQELGSFVSDLLDRHKVE